MKIKLLFIPLSFLFSLQTFAQSPNWLWAKAMGGTGNDFGNSIVIDDSGNVYTTGGFGGTVDFDPDTGTFILSSVGGDDIFISKLDHSGNFLWARAMGSHAGKSIALDPNSNGNVYTTGSFHGTVDFDPGAGVFNLTVSGANDNIFISKLDSSGNFIWAKGMGGQIYARGFSIAIDASDNVYTTGTFYGTADFDPGAGIFNLTNTGGGPEIFVSKLDSSGNFLWAKAMSQSSGGGEGYSIKVDALGNVYTTGQFSYTADFDPGAGVFNLTSSAGNNNIFISKLDSSGNFVWAKQIGSGGGISLAIDGSGNIYTTGGFSGTVDFDPGAGTFNLTASSGDVFILKLDSAGNFLWADAMGGTGSVTVANSIDLDAFGNVFATGFFNGTVDFDPGAGAFNITSALLDIFISKLSSTGNFIWAKAVGGNVDERGKSIALDSYSNVYVTGHFNSPSISFDSDTLTNTGNDDIFIAKLSCATLASIGLLSTCHSYTSPSGNYIWTASGTYLDTIPNSAGCDSVITITLTFIPIDTSITQNGVILTANAAGAIYQWLNCDSGFAPISGDTNQVFTPSVDGSYAAAITQDGCTDTSDCHIVTGVGITEIGFKNNLEVFPNPATNELRINLASTGRIENIEIYDMVGEKILHRTLLRENKVVLNVQTLPAGIYFLNIQTESNSITQKLIIQK